MLVGVLAGESPGFAELAAAAHVADRVVDPLVEHGRAPRAEVGELRYAIGAVGLDHGDAGRGLGLWLDQRLRHHHPVAGRGLQVAHRIVARPDGARGAQVQVGEAVRRRVVAQLGRRHHPVLQREGDPGPARIGEHRGDVALGREGDLLDPRGSRRHAQQARIGALPARDVEAVGGRVDPFDDAAGIGRDQHLRRRHRRAGGQLQHLEGGGVLVAQEEQILPPGGQAGDAIDPVQQERPRRARIGRPLHRRRPHLDLVLHAVLRDQGRHRRGDADLQHRRLVRAELRAVAGPRTVERHRRRSEIPRHQRRVAVLFGARVVRSERLQLDEIDLLGIVAPGGGAELRPVDRAGDLGPGRRVIDEDLRGFGAALGDADGDLGAVRRRQGVVDGEGLAVVPGPQRGDVDQLAHAEAVADHQVEVVRPRRALLIEHAVAIGGVVLDEAEAAGEGGDPLLQLRQWPDRVQHPTGVAALRLDPVNRRRIQRFHVAVVVGDGLAEQGLDHRLDRGLRRRRPGGDRGQGIGGRGPRGRGGGKGQHEAQGGCAFHRSAPQQGRHAAARGGRDVKARAAVARPLRAIGRPLGGSRPSWPVQARAGSGVGCGVKCGDGLTIRSRLSSSAGRWRRSEIRTQAGGAGRTGRTGSLAHRRGRPPADVEDVPSLRAEAQSAQPTRALATRARLLGGACSDRSRKGGRSGPLRLDQQPGG